MPLYATASGKLFLSAMPARSRERFLRVTPLIRHTPNTITDPAALARELEAIRARGYSVDDGEYLAGTCCVAVLVPDAEGRSVAALAVHAASARLCVGQAVEYLPLLRQSADAIGQTLDW